MRCVRRRKVSGAGQMLHSDAKLRKAFILAAAGALGFWAANFAISLTPVAADYRTALSIPYAPMLLEALLGGLIIGFCVSCVLLRFFAKLPTRSPILKAILLSLVALFVVTVVVEVPAKLLTTTTGAWRSFFIAGVINLVRLLALGVVIGYLYDRLDGRATD